MLEIRADDGGEANCRQRLDDRPRRLARRRRRRLNANLHQSLKVGKMKSATGAAKKVQVARFLFVAALDEMRKVEMRIGGVDDVNRARRRRPVADRVDAKLYKEEHLESF